MDEFVLRIFQNEIALQCKFIVSASHELESALVTRSSDEAWKHLQTILVSSANISKMLWGSRGKKNESRSALRESLGVEDDSPIRDPNLRNDFEHFDERLEEWNQSMGGHYKVFFSRNIGPRDENYASDPGEQKFQHFDHTTGIVSFWDREVSIPAIVAEAKRILPIAERAWNPPTIPWQMP